MKKKIFCLRSDGIYSIFFQSYWKIYWQGNKNFILGARGRKRESIRGKRSGDREEINWCCKEPERDGQKHQFKGRQWQRVCGVTGMCNLSIWQQKVLTKQEHKPGWKKCKNGPMKHDRTAKEVYVVVLSYNKILSIWYHALRSNISFMILNSIMVMFSYSNFPVEEDPYLFIIVGELLFF